PQPIRSSCQRRPPIQSVIEMRALGVTLGALAAGGWRAPAPNPSVRWRTNNGARGVQPRIMGATGPTIAGRARPAPACLAKRRKAILPCMTFLFCALVVILGLAILNGIACWFVWDVAQEAEAPAAGSHVDEAHGHEARGT